MIRNTYKQNLQGNNGTNSKCDQRVNIRKNWEKELKNIVRRYLDSSNPQHSTHMNKTKQTDSHLIPSRPSVGIYYSYYTMATKHYFNRTEKPTYHNLCTYLQAPPGINRILGNNINLFFQNKYPPHHLQDYIGRFKQYVLLKFIFQD